MKIYPILLSSFLLVSAALAATPNTIPHQGRVAVDGSNYDGNGDFKFLLFEDTDTNHSNGGEVALWANDDNASVAFAEPSSAITLPVNKGLYAVSLGDALTMTALPNSIAPSAGANLYLRIWFDGGTGTFQQFTPDLEIAPVAMALVVPGNAMGLNTLASGKNAAAFGLQTVATGDYSTTFGRLTFAPSAFEVALGRFNTNYTPASTTIWDSADRLFVIGNGSSLITTADILSIWKDGLMEYNGEIDVVGSVTVSGAFDYTTPKEYQLQLPATAFTYTPANALLNDSEIEAGYKGFTTYVAPRIYASVDLPDGATITSVVVAYYDNDNAVGFGSLSPPSAGLYRKAFTSTGSPQLVCDLAFSSTAASSTTSMRYLTKSGGDILYPTVNEYQYWVVLNPFTVNAGGSGTVSSNLRFYGVQITYTMDEVSR